MRRDSSGDDADNDDGGLTELFGSENFREYDDSNPFVAPPVGSDSPALPAFSATALSEGGPASEEKSRRTSPSLAARAGAWWAKRTRAQKRAVAGAGTGATLVLVLVVMFAVGSAIGRGLGAEVTTSDAAGPDSVGPGVYAWSALQGGECLEPFDSVWAEEFTVVECTEPHTAQLLYRGEVGPEVAVYLDAEGWQGLVPTLCDAETLLDFDAAAGLTDLTWQLSYAGDATEWANGERGYSCFVTRSTGENLDASLLAKP